MSIPLPENFNPQNRQGFVIAASIGLAFFAGLELAPSPDRSKVCSAEIREIAILKDRIAFLESENERLKDMLERCEDSTDARLRKQADLADERCEVVVASTLAQQKERFLQFKCRECAKRGLCK